MQNVVFDEPIRILQVIPSFYYGGSQAMILNIYKKIDRTKIQFDFIVDHPEYKGMKEVLESMGARTFEIPAFNGKNLLQVRRAWSDFFVNHPEYKVLHSHTRSYASIYLKIAKKYGVKTIIHSHNTSNGRGIKSLAKQLLQYPLRNQADYLIGCSLQAGKWLFGKDVEKRQNFAVLNNAIDTDRYVFNKVVREEYRKQFNIKNEKVFLQVGRFTKQKNYPFMLHTFAEYLKVDHLAKLVLVGDGELKQEIENIIDKLNISNNVILLSYRDDVNNLLQMADFFVMPSLWEGLSVAAIEAQASGIPCLMSENVNKDVNITGLCIFTRLDCKDWTNQMSNPPINRENKKQDIINAGFDVESTSQWLVDLYRKLMTNE